MKKIKLALGLVALMVGLLSCGETTDDGGGDGGADGAPVIDTFTVDSQTGDAPLEVTFSWRISDPEGDALNCTLEFGDDTAAVTVDSCTSTSTETHTYTTEGEYTAKLTVSDGENSTSESQTINVGTEPTEPTDPTNPTDPTSSCDNADNNTFATAFPLDLDTPCNGTIAESGDKDYFRVTIDEPGVLIMTLDPVPSAVRMRIVLYDNNQNELAQTRVGDEGQARTLEYLDEAGTYYVLVDNSFYDQSSTETYTLNVTFDTTDGNEFNNTFSDAEPLTLVEGEVTTTGTIRSVGDQDFFEVTVNEPGVLVTTLDPVPSAVRMQIVLYNQQQNEIAQVRVGNEGQARTLEQLVGAGTYFILLDNSFYDQSSAETYTLKVNFDTTDENELNNTFSDASALAVGSSVQGTIRSVNDQDYFRLELTQGGTLNLALDPVPSTVRMRIVLFDQQQNQIDDSRVGNPGQPRSLSRELTAGTYYVLLDNSFFNQSSSETYTLTTSLN